MTSTHPCRLFSLAEIQSATKNFDDELVIGKGGFGKVYKGQISSEEANHVVAIKRLDSMSNQGELEFRAEIDMLSKLRHCHLVSLIGYCHENKEMILVYDFMPNGTVYHHLHKVDSTPLCWLRRLKIAIGAARGLDYLHTGVGTQHGVIHRDVKSSNILLDENWAAMISDFGLSKIGPTNQLDSCVDASVKGTFGYLDPEYFYTSKLTRKTDVYAFGVVLFELLSGRLPVDKNNEDQCSLVRWAQKCVKERKLDQLVDSNIKGTISPKCLRRFAQIAYRCVHNVLKERPTMTEVVASLQALLVLHEKSKHSAESLSIMGFTWKMPKYFVSATKPNSDQRRTNSPKSLENNMNQHEELVTREVITVDELKLGTYLDQSGTSSPKSFKNINKHEELMTWDVKLFTYDELKLATRNFVNDRCLGKGRYAEVYKGWVNTELPIVVKKLRDYRFIYVSLLEKIHHPNHVKLLGCCLEGKQLFLVYEFMRKGNFTGLLRSGVIAGLPLVTKVKMVVGLARGLVFLQDPHFNPGMALASDSLLERHKILIDEDFTAKLSDYDISLIVDGGYRSVSQHFHGTEYELQSDIFGFEVVFVEVLIGKRLSISDTLKIDRLFCHYGKESLSHIAKLCFNICNEVDSESKMLTMLKEHDELIRERMETWLDDPHK